MFHSPYCLEYFRSMPEYTSFAVWDKRCSWVFNSYSIFSLSLFCIFTITFALEFICALLSFPPLATSKVALCFCFLSFSLFVFFLSLALSLCPFLSPSYSFLPTFYLFLILTGHRFCPKILNTCIFMYLCITCI